MIQLYQFAPAWGINPSPFCLKVETYLRLARLPYQVSSTVPFRAPKGKLPYMDDGGRKIADSGQIIAYLGATYGDRLDGGLTDRQRALGHLMRRTCEESLYFVLLYSRWIDEGGWPLTRQAVFGELPAALGWIVPRLIRRKIAGALRAQGYGRHSRDEVYSLGLADLDALAVQLGTTAGFAVSDAPTSFDAILYAFLVSLLRPPLESPLKRQAQAEPSLVSYVARMEAVLAEAEAGNKGSGASAAAAPS